MFGLKKFFFLFEFVLVGFLLFLIERILSNKFFNFLNEENEVYKEGVIDLWLYSMLGIKFGFEIRVFDFYFKVFFIILGFIYFIL